MKTQTSTITETAGSARGWLIPGLMIGLVLVMHSASMAQEATGKIIGTVIDPHGAVVPGATVTVTNTATQASRETMTDKDGNFEVISLPIGMYQVTAERAGFKKATSDSEKLLINQSLRFQIKMEVGTPSETVNVTSGAAPVETVNPTIGQSVTSRPIVNLPLNGRNVLSLALLMPGVTEKNPDAGGQAGDFSIGGGRTDSVTFLLDGGVNNNLLNNGVVFNPNPDAVAEFRILQSNYTAEYGRNGGGIISVVTKSGANQFTGSAFEFLRNNALNANSFFRNRDGLPREILKRNQFGFTIGGPMIFPRFGEGGRSIVNGRNRAFFFASYQGQRQVQTQSTASITVPTPAELRGDFSLSNTTRTGPNPGVVSFLQRFPFFQPNAALAAQGIIDPSRINSIARRYIGAGFLPISANGQLISSGNALDNRDELTLKFDVNIRHQDTLSVTLGAQRNPTIQPFSAVNVPGFPIEGNARRYLANIAYVRTFSTSLINDLRFTVNRRNQLQAKPAASAPTAAALGIGITSDNPTGPPRVTFGSGLQLGFSPQGPTTLIDTTYTLSDTVSWIRGKHSWKFGGSISPYHNDTVFDFFVNGRFSFTGTRFTTNNIADFLLGLPRSYLQFGEAPSNIRSTSYYGFAQDEWKVRSNLTISLGLRYEYSQPKVDTLGRSFSLQLGAKSTVFPNAPVGLLFPGDPSAPKGANFPDRNDWAPRFGFAWDPWKNGKTSIRGGFGVFYDILKGEDNLQFNGQAPFFGFAAISFRALTTNPTQEVGYFSQPFTSTGTFNNFPSRSPAPNIDFGASGFLPFGDSGVFFVDPHLRTPYTYQYNLGVQREVAKNLVVEADYVGSASHKLTSLVDANPFILGTTHRLFNVQPGNNDGSFSFLSEFRNVANANYNSLQLSANKRVSDTSHLGTMYFTFAYTLSHSIDTASGFRERNSQVPTYNSKQFRANSDFDVRHRISFSGGWDLPLNRVFSSLPSRLTRGWSLYPIISYRTGFPLDISAQLVQDQADPGPSAAGDSNLVHANFTGTGFSIFDPRNPQTFNNRIGNFFFNPAAFTTATLPTTAQALANPALRTYGSVPRNFFRGPGRTNVDLALAKVTPLLREHVDMEFRAEFFNIFNHTQFGNPSTNILSGSFGQVSSVLTDSQRIIQFGVKLNVK